MTEGEELVERLRNGDTRKCPFPDIDIRADQPCPVCGDLGLMPGDPDYVETPTRCVRRSSRLLLGEAATALAERDKRIAELEGALQAAADEFDGTISSAERAQAIADRARTTEKKDG